MEIQSPYSSPQYDPSSSSSPDFSPPGQRPGGLTAVAILAIILGGLGLLGSVSGLVMLLIGAQARSAMIGLPRGKSPAVDVPRAMTAEMQQITDHWKPYNLVALPLEIMVDIGLVWGSILVLLRRRTGCKLLTCALWGAIATDLARMVLAIPLQLQMIDVVQRHMPQIMAPQGQVVPPETEQMMHTVMKVSMFVGIAFAAAWVVVKLVYYGLSIRYLGRPHVRAYLDSTPVTAEVA